MSDETRVLNALTEQIRDRVEIEGLVDSYIVIASFTDAHGKTSLYTETMKNQRCHETLGLLAFAMAQENHSALTGDDG